MSTCIFLNGRFFGGQPVAEAPASAESSAAMPPIVDARVWAMDAGLQHAVGVFETMIGGLVRRGVEGARSHGEETETWVLHLDDHIERLVNSARELGLSEDLRSSALQDAVLETVRRSGLERARIRLTVTGGDLAMLTSARTGGGGVSGGGTPSDPTVLIVAQPATNYPRAMLDHGVGVSLADTRANPLNAHEGHKTLNYWWRLRELQAAARKSAAEALVLSVSNHVCGGCVSNIMLVKGDELQTPIARGEERDVAGKSGVAMPSPVLPGITRAWVLDKADRLGLKITKRMLSIQDVLAADEALLTNSSWGVLPVVKVEGSEIASGKPGPVTLDLVHAWGELAPSAAAE